MRPACVTESRKPEACATISQARGMRYFKNNPPSCLAWEILLDKCTRVLPKHEVMKAKYPVISLVITFGFLAFLPDLPAGAPPPDGCYPGFTTAEGCNALQSLAGGAGNTGLGWYSLFIDTTGSYNTGVGAGTLVLNNADSNTAVGAAALLLNTTGTENTATGTDALVYNDSGSGNTAIGWSAGSDVDGEGNICIGSGSHGVSGESFTIRIGGDFSGYNACYISGISGADVNMSTAALVYVDDTGKLGTVPMAAGRKKMPVPVPRGADRQAMLNKSEHRKIAQLQATITELKATVARQQKETQALAAQVKEQAAQIQKVSAQLEMSQPATTVVTNTP